jgi:hypothetical protein
MFFCLHLEALKRVKLERERIIEKLEGKNRIKPGTFVTPVDTLVQDDRQSLSSSASSFRQSFQAPILEYAKKNNEKVNYFNLSFGFTNF